MSMNKRILNRMIKYIIKKMLTENMIRISKVLLGLLLKYQYNIYKDN